MRAEAITRKAVELAKATAIRICMDRIVPARRDHHVIFELPKIETPADGVRACSALLETVAGGALTPLEASELVDAYIDSIDAIELEERLAPLERRQPR